VKAPAVAAALAESIARAAGESLEIAAAEPVGGGCIHTALCITASGAHGKRRYFAKVNAAERAPLFAAEADGLAALRDAGGVRVPQVLTRGADGGHAWLILEWLDLAPLDTRSGARLGAALAAQHRMPQQRFGWARDNFIGASPQVNGWSDACTRSCGLPRTIGCRRASSLAASASPPTAARSFAATAPRNRCCTAISGAETRRRSPTARRSRSIRRCTWATAKRTSR
jgi:hypothetical protein